MSTMSIHRQGFLFKEDKENCPLNYVPRKTIEYE